MRIANSPRPGDEHPGATVKAGSLKMAIFRKVHVSFWGDAFVHSLKESEKLFFMYLLTNEKTSQCGIYEITKQKISFDLGYSIDRVSKLLKYFISKGKIRYNEQTFELAVKNWMKYNGSESPKMKAHVNQEFSKVKDKALIEYLYSMDTASQEDPDKDPEQYQDAGLIKWEDFISGFNEITKKNFKVNDKIKGQLSARSKEGYKLEGILKAVSNCFSDQFHKDNPKYLTPEFILRADKLDKYINYSKAIVSHPIIGE